MDALESNKIQSIEGQISSINTSIGLLDQTDDQLEGYINALKEQLLQLEADGSEEHQALRDSIKALQAVDDLLHGQIKDLKSYVDTKLSDAKDWVKTTFLSLEKYDETVKVIAGIQAHLDTLGSSITTEYQKAIAKSIEESAESMKTWVNEQLTGYYDIATMNTKLDFLKSALGNQINEQDDDLKELIGQNTKDIETLESDLKQAKIDITDAYKKAIEEAITKYDGAITETIQKEIDSVNETIEDLDGRVTDLETVVSDLEDRMDKVENGLKNLASITYIPKYADGIEHVVYSVNNLLDFTSSTTPIDLTLRFDVYPAECADSIVTAYSKWVENKSAGDKTPSPLTARAVYTLTKASAGDFVNLDIKCVKADQVNKGVLSVTISPVSLDSDFISGDLDAAVVLKVNTGYSNIQSDYIRMTPSLMPYLIFSAASAQGFKMTLPRNSTTSANIGPFEYSTDDGTVWTKVTESMDYVTFGGDVTLMLRGKSECGTANYKSSSDYSNPDHSCNISFSDANVPVYCSGDIRALIDWEDYSKLSTSVASFSCLFCDPESKGFGSGYAVLSSAPALPAETLIYRCYENMFSGCTALKAAPALPAKKLAFNCYKNMFSGCIALKTAPALPATVLEWECYRKMFSGCTALEVAPALPAKTLTNMCYESMFSGCTALKTAPELPAKTLASYCYENMFSGCTNLNEVTVRTETYDYVAFINWLRGVAASGKMHKSSSLTLPLDSSSGIPSGWTAVNDVTD